MLCALIYTESTMNTTKSTMNSVGDESDGNGLSLSTISDIVCGGMVIIIIGGGTLLLIISLFKKKKKSKSGIMYCVIYRKKEVMKLMYY